MKVKFITVLFALIILGCNGQHIKNQQIKSLIDMSSKYCNERGLKNCERYQLCIADNYDTMKKNHLADFSIADSYIILYSTSAYEGKEYVNLMDNAYSLIAPNSRYSNDPAVTMSVGYFIYAHNTCANIIGDKIYNIDAYMPLLEKELDIHTQ